MPPGFELKEIHMATPGTTAKKKPALKVVAGASTKIAGADKAPSAPRRKRSAIIPPTPEVPDPERRQQMIQVAAYLRAQKRGFQGPGELEDWLQAEREVDAMLLQNSSS